MLKVLQAMLRQYMNWELPAVQARFRKARVTRDQMANIYKSTLYLSTHLILTTNFWGRYHYFQASQVAIVVKNLPANAGEIRDMVSICGLGRSSERGNGNPFQYSCPENPMDRGAWRAIIHGVTKSQKWLSATTQQHHCFHHIQIRNLGPEFASPAGREARQ